MLTYVQNEKGKQMLLYEGHIFEVNKRTHEGRIIWRCKEYYRKEQALNELQMDQATAGVPTAKPRKKYRDCKHRSAVASYNASSASARLSHPHCSQL
ncbi:MAG: hypothetical protein FD143_3648 [Ignavibacteria bacterium]|nr:MAG: hypothetical protein FD143_3648 [Ignavibacteria bacterium]